MVQAQLMPPGTTQSPNIERDTEEQETAWSDALFALAVSAAGIIIVELLGHTAYRAPTLTPMLALVAFVGFRRGLLAGLISATVSTFYGIYYFSDSSALFEYSRADLIRVIILAATSCAVAVMVGILHRNQRASEQALRRQLHFTQALVGNLSEGVVAVDLRGMITFLNPYAELLVGKTTHELLGRSLAEIGQLIAPNGTTITSDQIGAMPYNDDFRLVRADGSTISVGYAASSMTRGSHETGFVVVIRDVSARKQTERRLQEAHEALRKQYDEAEQARSQIRALLDAANDVVIMADPAQRFVLVNRRFGELFGVDPREVVGHTMDEAHAAMERIFSDPGTLQTRIAEWVADRTQRFTLSLNQKWPVPRELELVSAPVLSAEDEFIGRLYMLRDVTSEREVDRMKTEFVSLISHELRTPLTSIHGYLDMVLEEEVGPILQEQREFLDIVKNNADRLLALINGLLDVSRIEAGAVELRFSPMNLGHLIRQVAISLRPQLDAKRQNLTLDIPDDLPAASGDSNRVTQILTNLLSNAHKYTPEGGKITLRAAQEDQHIRVEVRDTGIGMSAEEQQKLFTKFYRVRNRATREVAGTGLGLAITRSLVEMHGGHIHVESEPGQGSSFVFTLPMTTKVAGIEDRGTRKQVGGVVLVVDDEPDIVALMRRYLERAGYTVLAAQNAEDAFELAQTEHPDLITLDILLPGTSGLELLEQLKSSDVTASIPVVLLSILDDSGRGKLLGAVDYLSKPIDEHSLLEHIGSILEDGQQRLVLVVDDDDTMRSLIAGNLRRAGYAVIEASDGKEALQQARLSCPSLALIDIRMSGMDGVELLRALRADKATCEIAIIMMSASPGATEEHRSVIEALGAKALLTKPYTREELAAVLADALQHSHGR